MHNFNLRKVGMVLVIVLIDALMSAGRLHAQGTTTPTQVDLSRGGVTFSSGINSMSIGARLQVRSITERKESFDADTVGSGLGQPDGIRSQFDVTRLRLSISGGVFQPWMKYLFQLDFSRTNGESDSKIKDAIFEVRPPMRNFRFMMGQFKVPFGMQQITSSGRQQFVERSITDNKFSPARDMGAMFSGTVAEKKLGYAVGLFNGSGESVRQLNRSQLWAARVFLDPLGEYNNVEGSSDAGEKPILHVGFAARGGEPIRGRSLTGVFEDANNQTAFDAEFAFKSRWIYSTVEHFWMIDEQENPVSARDINSRGFHAQFTVMPVPAKVELGIRYAQIEGDTQVDDAKLQEIRGVFGYYFRSHNLKLVTDFGQVRYGSNYSSLSAVARSGLTALGTRLVTGQSLADTEVRMELQVSF